MKLHIVCQYSENYGAHDWDGKGTCPQRWKMKGGEDYFYPLGQNGRSEEALAELVNALRSRVEWHDQGSSQQIVGYGVVADDYLTEFEQSQLEYEGFIQFPAKILAEIVEPEEYSQWAQEAA
jgi:hypothetical protein